MKYLSYIVIGSAVIALIYFGLFSRTGVRQVDDRQTNQSVSLTQAQWETKIDEQSSVVVKVTPVELGKSAAQWKFDIVLDTHSGSLDQDVIETTILSDGKGNVYKPIVWEGPGPGGHHREGVLIFNAINPAPAIVELKIKDVDDIPERLFTWSLE